MAVHPIGPLRDIDTLDAATNRNCATGSRLPPPCWFQPRVISAQLSHARISAPSLCHSVGAPQVQADAPSDQGGTRLVRPAASGEPPALRPLASMSWQWPNIGSRVNREVHARFWERPGVKLLRATRQPAKSSPRAYVFRNASDSCLKRAVPGTYVQRHERNSPALLAVGQLHRCYLRQFL